MSKSAEQQQETGKKSLNCKTEKGNCKAGKKNHSNPSNQSGFMTKYCIFLTSYEKYVVGKKNGRMGLCQKLTAVEIS